MVIMANVLARENTRSWQCSATTSGMQAMQQSDRSQVTACGVSAPASYDRYHISVQVSEKERNTFQGQRSCSFYDLN